MEAQPERTERDTTDEWVITPGRSPLTVAELEGRIDVALATAHSAEEAALEIGAASLEAAEQARRAAALAERASASAVRAAESAREAKAVPLPVAPVERREVAEPVARSVSTGSAPRRADPFEERITAFAERAERVMARLQRIDAPEAPPPLR
jgi:hypothetical protein